MKERVSNFMPATEESPWQSSEDRAGIEAWIEPARRQFFLAAVKADRESSLEFQLLSGQITVLELARGLLLSTMFRNDSVAATAMSRSWNRWRGVFSAGPFMVRRTAAW